MIDLQNIKIRPSIANDWQKIISLFESVGWLNRHMFLSEFPYCTVYVAADENDQLISCITCGHFEKYVYINHYITDPKYRGNGIGRLLWEAVIKNEGPEKNFFLKAVPHMAAKYKASSGFALIDSTSIDKHVGMIDMNFLEKEISKIINFGHITICDQLDPSTIKAIISYDSNLHKEDTTRFFTVWLNHSNKDKNVDSFFDPPMYTVYAKNENGEIVGFGSIVKCMKSIKIGPLYADSYEIGVQLLMGLLKHDLGWFLKDSDVLPYEFNVPSSNAKMKALVMDAGLEFKLKMLKCFTKEIIDLDYDRIFCIALHICVPE